MTRTCSQVSRRLIVRSLWRASAALSLAVLPAAAQNQVWIKQPGSNYDDGAMAAAADGSGGVFVGGYTLGGCGFPVTPPPCGNPFIMDPWFAHYDGLGNQLWIRQLGTNGTNDHDEALALAPDGSGGVYVAGRAWGSVVGPSAGLTDAWFARYDSTGTQLWIRQLGSSGDEHVSAAASDGLGGVYVVGTTTGSLGGANAGSSDAWFARYDGAGNQIWIRQLGTSTGDAANAAGPDGTGGLFIGGAGVFELARYDSAGNPSWSLQLTSGVTSASPDGSGGVYVVGSMGLARFDNAGNQISTQSLPASAQAVVADGIGGAYVCGSTVGSLGAPNAGMSDAWFAHYDSSGNSLWIEQLGTLYIDGASALAGDGSGGVIVAGEMHDWWNDSYTPWLARYNDACGGSVTYCSASLTSISGCKAAISSSGTPSVADPNSFTIASGNVPGGNLGIAFFGGNGFANIPFGTLGGKICVQAPFFRSSPKASGGSPGLCNGSFSFKLQDLVNASPIISPGAVIHAEIWARDPGNPDSFLLSNALRFIVCP